VGAASSEFSIFAPFIGCIMSKPLIYINATKRELGQFKAFRRKFGSDYDIFLFPSLFSLLLQSSSSNKEDLSSHTLSQYSALILGASRDKFMKQEVFLVISFSHTIVIYPAVNIDGSFTRLPVRWQEDHGPAV
jgi:hypothetical protein